MGDAASSGMTAYKTKIDKLVFVNPRHIVLEMPAGSKMGVLDDLCGLKLHRTARDVGAIGHSAGWNKVAF